MTKERQVIPLTPKAFDTLVVLVRNSGHVVEKDELLKEVWPDTFVEEGVLAVNVAAIRKALNDGEEGQSYIETVPRRGYRFVGRRASPGRYPMVEWRQKSHMQKSMVGTHGASRSGCWLCYWLAWAGIFSGRSQLQFLRHPHPSRSPAIRALS